MVIFKTSRLRTPLSRANSTPIREVLRYSPGFVCADDEEAKQTVMKLAETINGVRAVDGGGLANARYVEDLTALLLNINRIYKAHSMIKIEGI